jgi:NAD(P)-dependent dehydrogenase (short-subunit alcohol dehydrogenase family)
MVDRLKGKVALVLGAGSIGPGWGNGKAASVAFAREGARVVCADINLAAAEETAALIGKEGGESIALRADATKSAEVEALVVAAAKQYGGLDILDNNVGVAVVGGVVEFPEADWDRVMAINLKSAFLGMKYAIPAMAKRGAGSIINISSIAALRYTGVPYASYYASKAALSHLTRTTAAQYAPQKIRVNAILPGLMETPMVAHAAGLAKSYARGDVEEMWRVRARQVPMGFGGDAWDVANAAVFLASDEARYITGIDLVVDGGITLKYA